MISASVATPIMLSSRVSSLIEQRRELIVAAAGDYDVPPVAVAGVIAAEWSLNIGVGDRVQDLSLMIRLAAHNEDWWESWARDSESLAQEAIRVAVPKGKWPIALVTSGYVVSFGPAQITPRTVLLALENREEPVTDRLSTKALVAGLLDWPTSIQYVACILDYEACRYEQATKRSCRDDSGLLATLFSSGTDAHLEKQSSLTEHPVLNPFGEWVQTVSVQLRELLSLGGEHR